MQTATKMALKKVLHLGLAAVLIALAITAATLAKQAIDLKKAIRDLKEQRSIDELVDELSVPTEAIHFDWKTEMEVAQARLKCYQAHGTTGFLGYTSVLHIARFGISRADGPAGTPYPLAYPANNATVIYNGSCENYWLQRASEVPNGLALYLENNTGPAIPLRQHPDVFESRVRPLLVRLLESYHPWPRLAAVRALLAWGDRSDQVLQALKSLLNEPKNVASYTPVTREVYSYETIEAAKLVRKHGLNVDVDIEPILPEAKDGESQGSRSSPNAKAPN